MRRRHLTVLPLAAAFTLAARCVPAGAVEWRADAAASRLEFTAMIQGAPVLGVFERFDVVLHADGTTPAGGSLDVTVEMNSATTGLPDVDRELPSPAWFDSVAQPRAAFHAGEGGHRADDVYLARGTLTLKGRRQDLEVPFVWHARDAGATMEGELSLARGAFAIGSGEWTQTDVVAGEVQVHFRVALRRAE